MKNWFLLSLALIVSGISFAQSDIAPYKQTKKLPDFEIETVGNGTFKTAQLKKNTPVIIMFSVRVATIVFTSSRRCTKE